MIESPLHDQLLVEAEDSPTQLQLTAAALLCLGGEEDEGGVSYHHPHSRLQTGTHVTVIVTLVVDDHLPRLEDGGGGGTHCREGGREGGGGGVSRVLMNIQRSVDTLHSACTVYMYMYIHVNVSVLTIYKL